MIKKVIYPVKGSDESLKVIEYIKNDEVVFSQVYRDGKKIKTIRLF